MLLRRPQDLAELLRAGRARAGLSQGALARTIGVSRQWISMVETGKTTVEFNLVVLALQALGYRIYVEWADSGDRRQTGGVTPGGHGPSQRTPLTRDGEPLAKQRTRRHSRNSARTPDHD